MRSSWKANAAAKEVDQELELLVRVDGEPLGCFPGRPVELCGPLAHLLGHLDENATAVLRVADAPRKAFLFQAVEHRSHRGRADARLLGELSGGHRAFPVEDVEAAHVGSVQAEVLADGLVEHVHRGLGGPDGVDELEDQFIARIF